MIHNHKNIFYTLKKVLNTMKLSFKGLWNEILKKAICDYEQNFRYRFLYKSDATWIFKIESHILVTIFLMWMPLLFQQQPYPEFHMLLHSCTLSSVLAGRTNTWTCVFFLLWGRCSEQPWLPHSSRHSSHESLWEILSVHGSFWGTDIPYKRVHK